MIHYGIIHAVHRETDTIRGTIASLRLAGIRTVTVFSDDGGLGATWNLIGALGHFVGLVANGDRVCILDDDLDIFIDAQPFIDNALAKFPDHAITLWTIEQNIPHELRDRSGWIEAPVSRHTWGGSVIIPGQHLLSLCAQMHTIAKADESHRTKPDAVLFEALESLGIRVVHHIPSLVTHTELKDSTLGNDHSEGLTKGYLFERWGQNPRA